MGLARRQAFRPGVVEPHGGVIRPLGAAHPLDALASERTPETVAGGRTKPQDEWYGSRHRSAG